MESFDLTSVILDGIKNSASDIHIGSRHSACHKDKRQLDKAGRVSMCDL